MTWRFLLSGAFFGWMVWVFVHNSSTAELKCCLRESGLSSAGSLPLKMTTGCTLPPCDRQHWINCDTVHISAHQYPVNILETQVFAIAACPRNILFTISPIRSAEDTKESRKSQYFLRSSDVECCGREPVPVATPGPSRTSPQGRRWNRRWKIPNIHTFILILIKMVILK